MHDIALNGCRAEPLASYLKGLGVFRLVAEQLDPDVAARWDGDRLILRTRHTEAELVEFFLTAYRPTPIVSPWSGGSGFSPGDNQDGIQAISESDDPRLDAYRRTIQCVREWPEFSQPALTIQNVLRGLASMIAESKPGGKRSDLGALQNKLLRAWSRVQDEFPGAIQERDDLDAVERLKKERKGAAVEFDREIKKARTKIQGQSRAAGKEELMARARTWLPEDALPWVDASFVLRPEGTASFNPVLGTGGNEGRLDFSNNFMKHISALLLTDDTNASSLVATALFEELVQGLERVAIGQFDPGRAGGVNQGPDIETMAFTVNRWDFVLALEGALLLAAAVTRRASTRDGGTWGSIPFTVNFRPVGFPSGDANDVARAETWLPLWSKPAVLSEVRYLFSEGRCAVGRRQARDTLDFSRAVGTLGIDRGIREFVRFAFLERRGKSYVALPAGRLPVKQEPALALLDELDPILAALDRFLRGFKTPPHTLASARQAIDTALFDLCRQPDPLRFQAVLRTLGRLEAALAQRDRSKEPKLLRPLSGLSMRWVLQAGGAVEVRLAAALASIGGAGGVGPLRSNLAGVHPKFPNSWDSGHGQRCWTGATLPKRLAGVLARRLMDAQRLGAPDLPLWAAARVHASDVLPFLYGSTDDALLEDLMWAFTLVDWSDKTRSDELREAWRTPRHSLPLPRDYCLLKLLFSPGEIRGVRLRGEPRIIGLLSAGRVAEACQVAVTRLRSSGLAPRSSDFGAGFSVDADRLAAALLIPVWNRQNLENLVLSRVDSNTQDTLKEVSDV